MAYATHPHSMVPGKRQDYQYPKRCLVATAMSLRDHLLNTPSECSFSDLTIVDENCSASCPRCLSDMESTIHALHDCKEAKEIPYSVAQRSLTWARYYADCSTPTPPRQTQRANRTGWPCTCSGWTSINVDGAVHSNTSMVSIGGLARNNNGNWIMGFYQS
ncbi:hypothetical protein V6N13_037573 [Hibiscus sabdariffa]